MHVRRILFWELFGQKLFFAPRAVDEVSPEQDERFVLPAAMAQYAMRASQGLLINRLNNVIPLMRGGSYMNHSALKHDVAVSVVR